jgi:hypothetical protein
LTNSKNAEEEGLAKLNKEEKRRGLKQSYKKRGKQSNKKVTA